MKKQTKKDILEFVVVIIINLILYFLIPSLQISSLQTSIIRVLLIAISFGIIKAIDPFDKIIK